MQVKVLTSEGCVGCQKLEKMLNEFEIKYELIDVTSNPEYLEKYPIFMAPGLVIDGELEFSGVPKKEELLQKLRNYQD